MWPLGIRNRKQMGKVVNAFQKEPSEMSPIFLGLSDYIWIR